MKRHVASKHDSRDYIERIQASSGIPLDVQRSSQVEIIEPEEGVRFIVVDGRFTFVEEKGKDGEPPSFIPFVGSQAVLELLPSVRIDDGAIRYILKGADVMRPGIVRYDDWGDKGRVVVVRDDAKGRGLAIGRTEVKSGDMPSISTGKCVTNLHHAGDRIWNSYKTV